MFVEGEGGGGGGLFHPRQEGELTYSAFLPLGGGGDLLRGVKQLPRSIGKSVVLSESEVGIHLSLYNYMVNFQCFALKKV